MAASVKIVISKRPFTKLEKKKHCVHHLIGRKNERGEDDRKESNLHIISS